MSNLPPFHPIRDAIVRLYHKVNLLGVITEFGLPYPSKGTDWVCTLKITDKSYEGDSLVVNIFAETMEQLPHIKSAGDIILLSQVVMKPFQDVVTAVYRKQQSSFALFEGKSSENLMPYQASSNFCLTDQDVEFTALLRTWMLNSQLDSGSQESLLLREIKEDHDFELVCKILHITEVSNGARILFVWDGTDVPPTSFQSRLKDEQEDPLPLQVEAVPLRREVLCTFPPVGSVLRVIIDESSGKTGLRLPESGCWVKLINIQCKVCMGLWSGVFTLFTRVHILSNEDIVVMHKRRVAEKRLSATWDRMPFSAFPWASCITETDHEHPPIRTLMDVLTYSQVTANFKCIVRVVAICPWQVESFRCSGNYLVKLTLEDPSARIRAYVYGEDGEKFFDGYQSMEVLSKKCNKLLGISEGDHIEEDSCSNPPWIQCCLKSYYLDKANPWATRKYRVFGTKLLG